MLVLFILLVGEMACSTSYQFLNFGSKVVIVSLRQWRNFSFVIQLRNLFFMKSIFENADSRQQV